MSAPAYDVVVVGGGPGGYAAALRARSHGLTAAVVEAGEVGGTCLHRGCIPSKALLHVAHLADAVGELVDLGLVAPAGPLDVEAAGRVRDGVVSRLHVGLQGLLKQQDVEVVRGWGEVTAPGVVRVHGPDVELTARHVVIAVGSAPVDLPGVVPDGTAILRSDDALRLDRVPATAAVVGGGAVGVEIASLWRSLGAEVTLVEYADRLLPLEDPDSSRVLQRAFKRRAITVRTGVALASAEAVDGGAELTYGDGTTATFEQVLVAVGRRPATEGCGLEALGVLDERGFVRVDELGRTAVEGLWAIGDAVPTLALAHAASAEGFAVADAIAGVPVAPVPSHLVPRVTYCRPEVASVGWTEAEARERFGDDIRCTTGGLQGNARALIEGDGGQVKLVTHVDGTLLGAHLVGPSATELIGEMAVAVGWEGLAEELGQVVHAHPSLAESLREVALAAAGTPFHVHA